MKIREVLNVEGVEATSDASARAAADPAANYATLGIPLTPNELDRIKSSLGEPSRTVGLSGLVAANPEILGAVWIDGAQLVVSVLKDDTETLRLARCLEQGQDAEPVRYVTAGIPPAELAALGDRIYGDRSGLAGDGIDVTVVETDPTTETITVGVSALTPEMERRLVERYGSVVRVVATSGPRPAWPPPSEGPLR